MDDWKKFWNEYPATIDETAFLVQVGHTVSGKPYSAGQFADMVSSIRAALGLGPDHRLLDVCCGNGVITRELARSCGRVVGVDFSGPLIETARRFNRLANITYETMDALDLEQASFAGEGPFDRINMYAALQHFHTGDLARLLEGMLRHVVGDFVILIGGVLDAERKHAFLDTPEKQAMYEEYCRQGRDRLGTWWDKSFVVETCHMLGLHCTIDDRSPLRPGAHYRFDARIVPQTSNPMSRERA